MNTVKVPTSVLVLSIVEIALGVVGVGLVLESEAARMSTTSYVAAYGYAAALGLAVALGLLATGLLSSHPHRARRVLRASICVGAAAFAMTAGYALALQISDWTTSFSCDGCPPLPPTVSQVVASVVLDIGGGALAALVPMISLVLLRNRFETTSEPSKATHTDADRGPVLAGEGAATQGV